MTEVSTNSIFNYRFKKMGFELLFLSILGNLLAQLLFFGFWIFQPREIMNHQINTSIHLIIIPVLLGIIIAYIMVRIFRKMKVHGTYSNILGILIILIALILMLGLFRASYSQIYEPWLIQAAWFFQSNLLVMGIYLSMVIVSSILIFYRFIQLLVGIRPGLQKLWIGLLFIFMGINSYVMIANFNTLGLYFIFVYSIIALAAPLVINVIYFFMEGEPPYQEIEELYDVDENLSLIKRIRQNYILTPTMLWKKLLETLRFLIIFFVLGQLVHLFNKPILLPPFQTKLFLYVMLGALIYIFVAQSSQGKNILYFSIIVTLIWFIFRLNSDFILNSYSFYDGSFETIFPFQVLFSNSHAFVVGSAVGFIVCYEVEKVLTGWIDSANYSYRSIVVPIVVFLFATFQSNFGSIQILGGHISYSGYVKLYEAEINTNLMLHPPLFWMFFPLLAVALISLINDYLIPFLTTPPWIHSLLRNRGNWRSRFQDSDTTDRIRKFISKPPTRNQRIIIGTYLILMVIIRINFLYIPQINQADSLPLISFHNDVFVYGAPSNIRYSPHQRLRPQSMEPIDTYNLNLAKNEYEAFQIILRPNSRSLNGFQYHFEGFTNINSTEIIDPDNLSILYVENVLDGQFPDHLREFQKLNLIEQRNHILWITAYTPKNCSTGKYGGEVIFEFGNQESFTVPITLNVWNFTVPETRHLRVNMGNWDPSDEILDQFSSHRVNNYGFFPKVAESTDQLTSEPGYTCYLNGTTNTWVFNWTTFDFQVEKMMAGGSNAFTVQNPYGMPRIPPIWEDRTNTSYSKWGLAYGDYYKGLQNHLEDKLVNESINWFDYAYIYFIDEFQMFTGEVYNREDYHLLVEQFLNLINASAPDLKIMTTTPPTQELENIREYIDIYCPITSDYNTEEWASAQQEGKEMWMYPCVGPQSPWPNSHLYNRLFEIRVLMWQTYYYNIDGFLYWSANAYFHGNYGMAYNGWGDGWFIYANDDGAIDPSIRWENYRDGIEDYEYLYLINATLNYLGGSQEDYSRLKSLVSTVTRDRYDYCDSGRVVKETRNEIGEWISELASIHAINMTEIAETPLF